jgi:Putative transposase DNA-binding domain
MLAGKKGLSQRTWCRVVFFGSALFGQGRSGPLPRKALLKKIAELCAVVLTDEYNTSKKCCGCGSKLVQYNQSRVFHCNIQRSEPGCSIAFIDRDKSASNNICLCGAMQLLGRDRPAHLKRPVREAVE